MGRRSVTEQQKISTLTWVFDKKLHDKWTFKKIADELEQIADEEGFFAFSISAIQKHFTEWVKAGQPDIAEFAKRKPKDDLVPHVYDEHEADNEYAERGVGDELTEHDAPAEHTEYETILPEPEGQPIYLIDSNLEQRMEEIARNVFHHMMNEMHHQNMMYGESTTLTGAEEIPPEPKTVKGIKGRRETRAYKRYTAGIDVVLVPLFEQEMKAKGLSCGKLLDIILWNRYGKPNLSYMVEDEVD